MYHKVLQKAKAKKTPTEFEQLQKVDMNAQLKEMEKTEKARTMKQMSLKHQNSGASNIKILDCKA